ncbi:hypothetical protein NDU88_010620 [Pleurodeles waltl]|uniref:Uncharacterized protein n=1 Tax=Pleurodeles waltl TaxID=8319 RepID=A0AAV7R129_PLEWA|nr:hypothetical protein NDU88_010620 [Pleurodeles waltl]
MSTYRNAKKEDTGKDLITKPQPKKLDQEGGVPPTASDGVETTVEGARRDDVLITRSFLEGLFGAFQWDITTFKQDLEAEVKDIWRDMGDLGQRVNSLERTNDSGEEELEEHRRELLELRDTNMEIHYQLEDLENLSRRSNIHLKGVLL